MVLTGASEYPRLNAVWVKLGKLGKIAVFPLNRIVLPIGWNRDTHKMKRFYPFDETRDAHTQNVSAVHISVPKNNIERDMTTKYSKICLSQWHLYHNSTKIEGKFSKQSLITQ